MQLAVLSQLLYNMKGFRDIAVVLVMVYRYRNDLTGICNKNCPLSPVLELLRNVFHTERFYELHKGSLYIASSSAVICCRKHK